MCRILSAVNQNINNCLFDAKHSNLNFVDETLHVKSRVQDLILKQDAAEHLNCQVWHMAYTGYRNRVSIQVTESRRTITQT
jgi:hypothetical protein